MSTAPAKRNVVVIGGSYVGSKFVDIITPLLKDTHDTVLIEKNSHFQHLFAFPRITAVTGFEHKAYIPYSYSYPTIVTAAATEIHPDVVKLSTGKTIPYEYLVLATGTGANEPKTKVDGIKWYQAIQKKVEAAKDIVIIGGGAFGVQLALDIRGYFGPSKKITVVHSREQLMNRFHPKLHDIVMERFKADNIHAVLGERPTIPPGGFPNDGSTFSMELKNGKRLSTDLALICTGNPPLSQPLHTLSPSSIDEHNFVRIKPTLQINDPKYPNVFAIGDIADTGAVKAARPGMAQAQAVANNIQKLIRGETDGLEEYKPDPPAIHLSLGLKDSVIFRNPAGPGQEPQVKFLDDGTMEMGCERVWGMKAPGITDYTL